PEGGGHARAGRGSLRGRVRGHESLDGGLPRVGRPRAARPGPRRPPPPAMARSPATSGRFRLLQTMTLEPLLASARTFVREQVVPVEHELLASGGRALPGLARLRERARTLGLIAPHLPTEYGGRGLGLATFGRLGEELGWSPLGHLAC